MTKTLTIQPDGPGVAKAAALLSAGQLVAFPTETVYGLGADARNGQAVAGIYDAKGRPSFNPLIVHVASLSAALELVDLPLVLSDLAEAFWPGPLTLVAPLRAKSGLPELVSAGLPTVAVRVPDHPLARTLLGVFGAPIAAPSANRSGHISPTSAGHVLDELQGRIAAVVDGGPCQVGLESTIIGANEDQAVLLRAGGLPNEMIEAVVGRALLSSNTGKISAPGQLLSHYAPTASLRLDAERPAVDEAYLAFGDGAGLPHCLDLSAAKDLHEAASNLFAHLRDLDALVSRKGLRRIAAASIPMRGLGVAINDRLTRAAAPRG